MEKATEESMAEPTARNASTETGNSVPDAIPEPNRSTEQTVAQTDTTDLSGAVAESTAGAAGELTLPPELWEFIVSMVNDNKDLKSASLTCKLFNQCSQQKLWNEPRFLKALSRQEWEEVAQLSMPITALKLTQFVGYHERPHNHAVRILLAEIVEFVQLSLPQLSTFEINYCHPFRSLGLEEARVLFQLPVSKLNTDSLNAQWGKGSRLKQMTVFKWIEFLVDASTTGTELILSTTFHEKMTIADFEKVRASMQLVEVFAQFSKEMDIDAYDKLISQLRPAPTFNLVGGYSQEKTNEIVSKIRLTKIHKIFLQQFDAAKLLTLLKENRQSPALAINAMVPKLTTFQLCLLADYPIAYLDTRALDVPGPEAGGDFVDPILYVHAGSGIGELRIDSDHNRLFDERALEKFRIAGIKCLQY